MNSTQLIILCAAQAVVAILGILYGVKRIRDMEVAARETARGITQLNTWDVDARIERLEGFREMVFRTNTKLGELKDRLSDHIKVFDGHVLDMMNKNILGRIGQLELDTPRLQKELDDRISGAYKAAQEAHAAAASVGSELEKVRRMGTVSPEVADGFSYRLARLENQVAALKPDGHLATKGEVTEMIQNLTRSVAGEMEKGGKAVWSRMTEVLDRLNDIEKGFGAFITKDEAEKMLTNIPSKESKAVWAHITQIHRDVSSLEQRVGRPPATQVPLKVSRPIDDLAKEMLKQQQDQYIVVPADMAPVVEKMFSGPEVTEAIGKELGWSSPESEMNLRIAFLEKLVKNDVENLCQLEKKVNDICKNTRHKADEDTLFGHFDARIKGLSKRVTNIEGKLPSGDESDDPDRETPFDCMSRRIDRALDRIQKLEVKRQEDDNQLDCVYKQIDSLGERVRNIEKQSESSRPTQTALAPKNNEFIVFPGDHPDQSFVVPADNIEAVAKARRKDTRNLLSQIKRLAEDMKSDERSLSTSGILRLNHIITVVNDLFARLDGGTNAV